MKITIFRREKGAKKENWTWNVVILWEEELKKERDPKSDYSPATRVFPNVDGV
jgi:hypothetical protein